MKCGFQDIYSGDENFPSIPIQCRQKYAIYVEWNGFKSETITKEQAQTAFVNAMNSWRKYLDVRLYLTVSPALAFATIYWKDSTGVGTNVLATSNRADNTCIPKSQAYNIDYPWTLAKLQHVALHELGHLLGFPHAKTGIMGPVTFNLFEPTREDLLTAEKHGYTIKNLPEEKSEVDIEEIWKKFDELASLISEFRKK